MSKLSFVTNATLSDYSRLKLFVPLALDIFDEFIDEFIIVIDKNGETGRIKTLHGITENKQIDFEFISGISNKIRFVPLDYNEVVKISSKYFKRKDIVRCQAGTPIFAFLYGLEIAKNNIVFRSDCDIFFHDKGFIQTAVKHLETYPIVQSPFLGFDDKEFSSRSFFTNKEIINQYLPFENFKLDLLRTLHRKIFGRGNILALEQIIDKSNKVGKFPISFLSNSLGYSMHINTRKEFEIEHLRDILVKFIKGEVPELQLACKHNFDSQHWKN